MKNSRSALIAAALLVGACAPPARHAVAPGTTAADPGDVLGTRDRAMLEKLTAERTSAAGGDGYVIGPDDLLDVRIPDLFQPTDVLSRNGNGGIVPVVAQAPVAVQGARVSGSGDITVPLVGIVHAAGMTAPALERDIAARLVAAGILRRPQVSVQVSEYRSHVVAVVGSVERPGLYPVTRPAATLADLVWTAGGPTKDAGRVVEFVPAAGGSPAPGDATAGVATASREPVRLDLERLLHPSGADARVLDPPVRPGDVISIAPAGTVQVDGWVQKPGSYQLTRGLTLTGAVAAAGGQLFPADASAVRVKRHLGSGEERDLEVNLKDVIGGSAPDLPMTDGDVVRLPASTAKLVPWGFWQVVREIFNVGGGVFF